MTYLLQAIESALATAKKNYLSTVESLKDTVNPTQMVFWKCDTLWREAAKIECFTQCLASLKGGASLGSQIAYGTKRLVEDSVPSTLSSSVRDTAQTLAFRSACQELLQLLHQFDTE